MRPIATSLPGICFDEKMTRSPSPSLMMWLSAGDPAERGIGLALPAGGDDHHLARRQAHRRLVIDRVGKVLEVTGRLGDPQ